MSDKPEDLNTHILQAIRAELGALARKFDEQSMTANRSIGKLAEGILQLRQQIESQGTDIHTMALAIGEHGARLAALEKRLPPAST